MRAWTTVVLGALALAAAGCTNEEAVITEVAVRNSGNDTVDVVIGDGEMELVFDGVAAGTTSGFRTASFGSTSDLSVSVGSVTSEVTLYQGVRNVVEVGADGRVEGVTRPQSLSSGGGGW